MTKSNSPTSLETWNAKAAALPYRASISGTAYWDGHRPSPDYIDASRVCPGGRMIMAFRLAAIRDFFVEGHADQGAQVEADWAERASPRATRAKPSVPTSYEEAFALYKDACDSRVDAERMIGTLFIGKVQEMLTEGRSKEAMGMARSIPVGADRSIAISMLQREVPDVMNPDAFQATPKTPLDEERANAVKLLLRARLAHRAIDDVFTEFADARVAAISEEQGVDAAIEFAKALPNGVPRMSLVTSLRMRQRQSSSPSAEQKSPGMR